MFGVMIAALGAKQAQATPAWCNVDNKEEMRRLRGSTSNEIDSALAKDPFNALNAIVATTCVPDDQTAKRASEIEAARQRWSKELKLTDADWADVADWYTTGARFTTDLTSVRLRPSDKNWAFSPLTPVEQFIAITNGIPNATSLSAYSDRMYLVDALGPRLSETGRFAHVLQCITSEGAVSLAICDGDVKLLDRAKVLDEVRADNRPGGEKMKIRLLLWQLDDKLAKYEGRVKQWRDKDPAYAQMFDIAAKTRAEWDQIWQTEKPLVELALAMDDARQSRSKKALAGCAEKTWPAWKQAVARIPASRFVGFATENNSWLGDAANVITNTPQGYLAGVALYSCGKDETARDPIVDTLGDVLSSGPGPRGPRLGAQWAIMSAGLQLDEQGAKIAFPTVRHDQRFSGTAKYGSFGTVAKIGKPDAQGMVQIKFATRLEKQEECLESKQTRRPSRVRSDGTLEYERECVKWGIVAHDRTPPDETVSARYLEGLKVGANVNAGGGAVFVVFPKGKKTPSAVVGVPVK
jgi:hypothetical protein